MAKFNSFSLAIFAILLASLFAVSTVEAAPAPAPSTSLAPVPSTTPKPVPKPTKPAPKPKPAKPAAFSIYSLPGLKGKVEKVIKPKEGCLNHKLKTVGSVKKGFGPTFNLQFYSGKNCKGNITHAMSSETVKQMGGPYKSSSVRITKCKGKRCTPMV
ncbi:hypothetical protein BGZ70_008753 [Mortierella alpina]|uniref:Uncharacterized protein n=1 Tax=Mortierella alpina TaxID=64518 RepID=A0A9P6J2Q2_MORAP|nr:hypothetical protein BGZ70_008753 [Mortierella alpina]